jgi:hypothetical protein
MLHTYLQYWHSGVGENSAEKEDTICWNVVAAEIQLL